MKILGISNAWDAGAALVVDGEILAAANEERFSRVKLDRCFPERAIDFVLEAAGICAADIDLVATGCWKGVDTAETAPRLAEDVDDQVVRAADPVLTASMIDERLSVSKRRDQEHRGEFLKGVSQLGIGRDRIRFFDHHYSHAVSAWSPSGFDDALVLTADGRGDGRSVTLWRATGQGLQLVDMATELVSPGALYGFITSYLGFVPDRHEGKVTGLAAHGQHSGAYDLLAEGFGFSETMGRLTSCIGRSYSPFATADLPDLRQALDCYRREDVAHAVQALIEESLVGFLQNGIERLGIDSTDLCLAGGCMGNVKLNYELSRLDQVADVYVFPHMGDGGLALGGAMAVELEATGGRVSMPTAYYGPFFTDSEIEAVVSEHGLYYERLEEGAIAGVVADLLAHGKVVGWFQGAMEVGPRALGARSILAAATDKAINDSLNRRLERTEYMPFAPATTADRAADCFVGWHQDHASSQFMTMCYDCTPYLSERCPAVVHVDGTARPQVVIRDHNPRYFDVISAYAELTGNPAIINTSFNHHEEPIVLSPQDAVGSLRDGAVDILVAGQCVVRPDSA